MPNTKPRASAEYAVVGNTFGGFGEGVHGRMQGVAVFYEGVMSLKEMPSAGNRGRCGCVSVELLRRLESRRSRGERVQHVRHHQLLDARVDGGEVAGLVHSLAHAAVISAAQIRV